jgi:O-antigen/teichoic acid export membrane protein
VFELGKWITGLHSRKVVVGTVAYGALEILSRAVQSGAILLLAHRFSKTQFGDFYTSFAVYQFVAAITVGGLTELLINGLAATNPVDLTVRSALLPRVLRAFLGRAYIACLVIAVFGALFKGRDGHHLDYKVLLEATIAGLGYGFVTLISSYLNCAGSDRQAILLRSAYLIGSYGLAVALVIAGRDLDTFFLGFCVVGLVLIGTLGASRPGLARGLFHSDGVKRVASVTAWFLVPALLNWFFWYGLVIFVSSYFGAASAADLAFTNNISAVLLIINTAISQAWISNYIRHHQVSKESAEVVNVRVFKIQSALMLVATIVMIAAYCYFKSIHLQIIQKYGDLGIKISVVLFAISVSSNYFGAINIFAINQSGRRLAVLSLTAYGASILLLLAAVHFFGIFGVYLGLALLFISRGFLITFDALRRFGAGFFDLRLIGANILAFGMAVWVFEMWVQ